jgi:hypothetical protein
LCLLSVWYIFPVLCMPACQPASTNSIIIIDNVIALCRTTK